MYQVIWQEEEKIEVALDGNLTVDEFRQLIHQLESLCVMYAQINVLFDAMNLHNYDFKIILDEFEFFKSYRNRLRKIALVSDSKFADFFLGTFNKFTDTEYRTFATGQIEMARKWIFPSRLP